MRKLAIVLILMLILALALGAIGCPTGEEASPTPPFPTDSAEDWEFMNRYLTEVHGLPPVLEQKHIPTAAWLLSEKWFDIAHQAIKKLEAVGLPWERIGSFAWAYHLYIYRDIILRYDSTTPMDLVANDMVLADTVHMLHEMADGFVDSKLYGEGPRIYDSEEEALAPWKADLEPLRQRAIAAMEKAEK